MGQGYGLRDNKLFSEQSLPNAASTTVSSDVFEVRSTNYPQSGYYTDSILEVVVPALNSTAMPANAEVTVKVEGATSYTSGGSWTSTLENTIKVIAGSSSGSSAVTLSYRLPPDCPKFIRVSVTTNASATDCSAEKFTAALVF